MTRRERLMATLRGEPVDRPAVNFYEIGGCIFDRHDPSPFNIYNSPDWAPLLDLAEEKTDLIRFASPSLQQLDPDLNHNLVKTHTFMKDGASYTRTVIRIAGRELTSLTRRDPAIDTVWTLDHLLKGADDLLAYLQLPDALFSHQVDVAPMEILEKELGEGGLVMVNVGDPLCAAASLFSMEDYTVLALTEQSLFHRLLEKLAGPLWRQTEDTAYLFPGRLWRLCGAEYASEPYLPPSLFEEYLVRYTEPMVRAIRKYGGFARLHCHGRLKNILSLIKGMDVDGLDPVEPPPQGDMELRDVRREIGASAVLFGNLEVSDIETLAPREFEKKVRRALTEGTEGKGRGFVLMPSSAPYGRTISSHTLENYRTMVRLAESWS